MWSTESAEERPRNDGGGGTDLSSIVKLAITAAEESSSRGGVGDAPTTTGDVAGALGPLGADNVAGAPDMHGVEGDDGRPW